MSTKKVASRIGPKSFVNTYSSVSGVIFFSGSSSSTNSFLYFSQFCPVALGILGGELLCLFVGDQPVMRVPCVYVAWMSLGMIKWRSLVYKGILEGCIDGS